MKDVVSLLMTTTCLAVAGLGIYFFSYKTDHDNDITQKNSRKKSASGGKKIVEVEEKNHDGYNDYDDYHHDYADDNSDNHDDNSYNHDNKNDDDIDDYNKTIVKTKNVAKKSASKTKKNKSKFASSKKRYYY